MPSSREQLDEHRQRLRELEADLCAPEMRISAYHDLPFAIYRYEPDLEYEIRRDIERLATRIENQTSREVVTISLADLLFEAVETTVGWEAVIEAEKDYGYEKAEETVHQALSDPNFAELPDMLAERLSSLDPSGHVAFLTRAASLAPNIYHISSLLPQMQGRTDVPTILFYPGTLIGLNDLAFMGIRSDIPGSYRVKVY